MRGHGSGLVLPLQVKLRLGSQVEWGGPLDKIRGILTRDFASTRQCNSLLVSYEESDRMVMWLA